MRKWVATKVEAAEEVAAVVNDMTADEMGEDRETLTNGPLMN